MTITRYRAVHGYRMYKTSTSREDSDETGKVFHSSKYSKSGDLVIKFKQQEYGILF